MSDNPYDQFDQTPAAVAAPAPTATPAAGKPAAPADKESLMRKILELGGAGALGAGSLFLKDRMPAVTEKLAALRDMIAKHPVLGAGAVGAGTGAAAAVPEAISQGKPSDVAVGAGLGAAAGVGGNQLARLGPKLAMLAKTTAPERSVASNLLSDIGDSKAVSDRLRTLATTMRAGARGPNPSAATVGDTLNTPRTSALTDTALASPSPQSQQYGQQLAQRQAQTPQRVQGAINQALAPDEYSAAEQKLTQALKTNSSPLYERAYSMFPSVNSSVLHEILQTPEGAAASRWATDQLQKQGKAIGPVGPGGMVTAPSLEYHQLVKEYLDGEVSKLQKAVATGSANNKEVRTMQGLRGRYVNELDALTGGDQSPYAAARQQYSSDAQVLDALHSGREDFLKMDPATLRAQMMDMDYASRDAFRSGAAEALFRQVGSTRNPATSNVSSKISSSPDMQDKLRALFDDPKQADAFMARLEQESQMFDQTKTRLAAARAGAQAGVQPSQGAIPTLAKAAMHSINPKLAAARAAVDLASGARRLPAGGISALMSQSGPQGANTLNRLAEAAKQYEHGIGLANTLGTVGTLGGGIAGGVGSGMLDRGQQP